MKKKILITLIGIALSPNAFSASVDLKQAAPNQYDCTVDELELYIMKRTEGLRKKTTLSTWEDFKTTKMKAQMNGANPSDAAKESGGSGSAEAEAIAKAKSADLAKTGSASGTGEDEEECNLFFSELDNIDTEKMKEEQESSFPSLDMLGSLFGGGGLDALKDLAKEQMAQLGESLMGTLKAGFCERLSTEYLTDLATDFVDDKLNDSIGYDTGDFMDQDFANDVMNDQLKEQTGESSAKLLNIMDEDLNKSRENYMDNILDNKLDDIEDDIIE